MRNEREKMLAGELYDPLDADLVAARNRARDLCQTLNASREGIRSYKGLSAHSFSERRTDRVDAAAVLL